MSPYEVGVSTSGGGGSSSSCSPPLSSPSAKVAEIDGLLAGAGYRVRSSDLRHVAQRLERLESAMTKAPEITHLASDTTVHYNPTDLASWVDSMLSELHPDIAAPLPALPATHDFADFRYDMDHNYQHHHHHHHQNQNHHLAAGPQSDDIPNPADSTWEPQQPPLPCFPPQQLSAVAEEEEDSGIRLVHLLMTCAESLQRGNASLAGSLIEEMQGLLTRVNTGCGIGKVAGYFVDALSRRLYAPQAACAGTAVENEILYHHFYEACPYLKFAHFTANQAILEAFDGHDCVHVIDFNLMHGLQWPALIQALALRQGGPPLLRLTGIGPPSPDGRDSLREIGIRLAELARSVNVRFAFRGVAASRLDDVRPWMLQVGPREAVAVNSVFQLHRLLVPDPPARGGCGGGGGEPIESVLGWIRSLNPRIVTVVEQEANHNGAEFLDRFTEALYYYSTMFDSLEACGLPLEKAVAEMYIQREICNVVCCEGGARVERHEPLERWRARMSGAGFRPLHLGSNAFKQASMLLTLFSAEGYCVEEKEGCLTLGWHSRPLIAASAWHASGPHHGDQPAAIKL